MRMLIRLLAVLALLPLLGCSTTEAGSDASAKQLRLSGKEFGFTKHRGLVYTVHKGRKMRLDLCLPDIPGPHPVALVIHGGAWRSGSRSMLDGRVLMEALAREGIAAASMSYRLAPRYPHPAQIEDCRLALAFLHAEAALYDLDPDRVCAIGASSGGHLAGLLGTMGDASSLRPDCVVAICAPMNLVPAAGETPTQVQIESVATFLGIEKVTDLAEALRLLQERGRAASPLEYVSQDDPPMLLIHGELDPVVPESQARVMSETLAEHGVRHVVYEVKGGSHGEFLFSHPKDWLELPPGFWLRIRRFLRQHMLGVSPA